MTETSPLVGRFETVHYKYVLRNPGKLGDHKIEVWKGSQLITRFDGINNDEPNSWHAACLRWEKKYVPN